MTSPASPLVDECMIDPVDCSAFMDEDCEYKNEAENILSDLTDPRSWQMFMNELGPDFCGGNYSIFQKNPQGKCEKLLYDPDQVSLNLRLLIINYVSEFKKMTAAFISKVNVITVVLIYILTV